MVNILLHLIANVKDNLNDMGIDANVEQINHSQVRVKFKSDDDYNLYRVAGKFSEGRYPESTYLTFIVDYSDAMRALE